VDGFPGNLSPYLGLGGWLTVIVLVIISMFRGWLIAGSIHKQIVNQLIKAYESQLADKSNQIENWREAYRASDARGDLQAENQRELLELARTNNDLIKTIGSSFPSQKENIR